MINSARNHPIFAKAQSIGCVVLLSVCEPLWAMSCPSQTVSLGSLAYNYFDYAPLDDTVNCTSLDAENASWTVSNSLTPNPDFGADCDDGGTLPINAYPISIQDNDDVSWNGGIILGEVPLNSPYTPTYCNSTALLNRNADRNSYTGLRMGGGAWDCVRFGSNSDDFVLSGSWISQCRDDCVENDGLNSGIVEDTLLEGCFSGFSFDPGNGDPNLGTGEHMQINNVILSMKAYDKRTAPTDPLEPGHQHFTKAQGNIEITFSITDSVFIASEIPFTSDSRLSTVIANATTCDNNIVLWTGNGDIPAIYTTLLPASCFDFYAGELAQVVADELRVNWIDCHPDINRFATDPVSNSSECIPGTQANVAAVLINAQGVRVSIPSFISIAMLALAGVTYYRRRRSQ